MQGRNQPVRAAAERGRNYLDEDIGYRTGSGSDRIPHSTEDETGISLTLEDELSIRSLPLAVPYRISVENLLRGCASGASQDLFRRWLEERAVG